MSCPVDLDFTLKRELFRGGKIDPFSLGLCMLEGK